MVKSPEHRFIYHLFEKTGKLPNDEPFESYEHINPFMKIWLYESWRLSIEEMDKKLYDHALFTGSFANPEAAQKIFKQNNPDFQSSDDELEKSNKMIREEILDEHRRDSRRRKKRKIVG